MSLSTIIDIVILLIILVSAGVSFFRGFVREVLTIFGFIGGALATVTFGPKLIPVFEKWFGVTEGEEPRKLFDLVPADIAAMVCAYAGIFIAVFLILQLISYFLSASVRAVGLGPVDRTLGVIFGIVRAVLFLGVLYWPFQYVINEADRENIFGKSKTFVYVEATTNWLQGFFSSENAAEAKDAAESFTRDKLKQIDVLHGEDTKAIDVKKIGDVKEKASGYSEQAREKLDSLIEDEVIDAPPQPNAQPASQISPQGNYND